MTKSSTTIRLGQHIDCIPVIHGRAVFASEVRRTFLADRYQCVAVELPRSLEKETVAAVEHLPNITAVVYEEETSGKYGYIPIDPGEGIIEAVRLAHGERCLIEFVDLDVPLTRTTRPVLPDEYAIQHVGLAEYYKKTMPFIPLSEEGSIHDRREQWMAWKLKQLDDRFSKILFVCGIAHLEKIRHYFSQFKAGKKITIQDETISLNPKIHKVHSDSLYLLVGEIPYLTFLYEKSRYAIDLREFDKTDGLKEILLEARKEICRDFPEEKDNLAPKAMQTLLHYLRNLCLVQGSLTPSMYDLVVAAQGVGGGAYAAKLLEIAKFYPYQSPLLSLPELRVGIDSGWTEPQGEFPLQNRLPGPPFSLKNIKIERLPKKEKKEVWKKRWGGGYSECSWPDEDVRIERFTDHVRKRAMGILGENQAKIEKFSSSIKDGIDVKETLRSWHTGDLYVKELPQVRGEVGAVAFVFDEDTEKYPWRSTWLAEHENESTLCFYATDYMEDMVGPGIGRAFYGGALFIFPPIRIPNIWTDPRYSKEETLQHSLVAAAISYSHTPYIAYVARKRPDLKMRSMAKQQKKHLIYLPITNFSPQTIRKLRKFHVLQGHDIRSYASKYIR